MHGRALYSSSLEKPGGKHSGHTNAKVIKYAGLFHKCCVKYLSSRRKGLCKTQLNQILSPLLAPPESICHAKPYTWLPTLWTQLMRVTTDSSKNKDEHNQFKAKKTPWLTSTERWWQDWDSSLDFLYTVVNLSSTRGAHFSCLLCSIYILCVKPFNCTFFCSNFSNFTNPKQLHHCFLNIMQACTSKWSSKQTRKIHLRCWNLLQASAHKQPTMALKGLSW